MLAVWDHTWRDGCWKGRWESGEWAGGVVGEGRGEVASPGVD
jgi:hypothetical protein